MKRFLAFFLCCGSVLFTMPVIAQVVIKKGAPVAVKQTSTLPDAATLLPTVLNVVGEVKQLKSQQKALIDECIPSSKEIEFVNSIIKEWAKTGTTTADEVETLLRRKPCDASSQTYDRAVQLEMGTKSGSICYERFNDDTNDEGNIWYRFPKVSKTTYSPDGSKRKEKTVSDIYDIFSIISFDDADYLPSEITMYAALRDKMGKCSNFAVSGKNKAMWGQFLTDTVSNIGQKTDTNAIMQSAGQVSEGDYVPLLQQVLFQAISK